MNQEDSVDQLVAEAERLTAFEIESSNAHALKTAGELGDCKVFVVNFTEKYATMYSKNVIKPLDLKRKRA